MSKDTVYLRIAREASRLSKDPKAKIGAVALSKGRIVSVGVNGYPAGYDDTGLAMNEADKHAKVIHAEINALLNHAGRPHDIDTLYVYGLPPCVDCMKFMAAVGVKHVIFYADEEIRSAKEWLRDFKVASKLHAGKIKFSTVVTMEI